MEEKRLNASAQNVPLIFLNSSGFINHPVHEKKKKQRFSLRRSCEIFSETCNISISILADSCAFEWLFTGLSHVSVRLR